MAEFSSPILGMRVRRSIAPPNALISRTQNKNAEATSSTVNTSQGRNAQATPTNTVIIREVPQPPQKDPETVLALQRNQLALQNINASLSGVAGQIIALSGSLQTISAQIRQSSILEQARDQQKNRQERLLAEQQIREGKEGLFERKIQSALSKPLRKIGGKAQQSLFNLGRFFNILLGGVLTSRVLGVISSLSENGELSLGNLFNSIKKDLAIVGSIFLGLNGGFRIALRTLTVLTSRLSSFALKNLLLKPITLAFTLAGSVLIAIADKLKGLPKVAIPQGSQGATPPGKGGKSPEASPGTRGGRQPQTSGQPTLSPPQSPSTSSTKPTTPVRSPSRPSAVGNAFRGFKRFAFLNFLLGGNIQDSAVGTASALAAGGIVGGPLAIPAALLAGYFAPGMVRDAGLNIPGGDTTLNSAGYPNLIDIGKDIIGRYTKTDDDLKRDEEKANTIIINSPAAPQQPTIQEMPTSGGSGIGNYLPSVSSSNSSNPYILHSLIQYNVGGSAI